MSQMPTTTIAATADSRVFSVVASITGHQVEELDRALCLENDLGMDSIKMVELMNALLGILSDEERAAMGGRLNPEVMMQAQTLGELVDLLPGGQTAITCPEVEVEKDDATVPAAVQLESQTDSCTELPIAWSQYPFLVAHWAISPCSLSSRLRLRGDFDPIRARRAWQGLLNRHPLLRGRFFIPADAVSFSDYRLEAAAMLEAPEVAVTDLSQLDEAGQEAALSDETHRNVNREWDLGQWPLHRFYAFRLQERLFELVLTAHHLCSDGLSMQQLLREFLLLYAGHDAPAPIAPEHYCATVEAMNAWHDPEQDQALEKFLRAQGKERFFWRPQGRPIASTRSRTHCFGFSLDDDTTAQVLSFTGKCRRPMNTILVSAYLRAVSQLSADANKDVENVVLNIPTAGRDYPGVDASQLVGCFAQNLALTFPAPNDVEDWEPLLARVDDTLRQAIGIGYDHAQVRQAALAARDRLRLSNGQVTEPLAGVVRGGIKSNLYLPYIGQLRLERNCGDLEVVDYHAATATNPDTVDLLAEVVHGRLTFTANYDSQAFSKALIQDLAKALLSQLRELVSTQEITATLTPPPHSEVSAKPATLAQIREIAGAVLGRPAGTEDLNQDLEADLGLDSLERVRIVTRLQGARGKIDHQALLACRTLREMVLVLDGTSGAVAQTPKPAPAPLTVTAGPAEANQAAIPYLTIAEQCRRTPEATAVASESETLSYAELARRANRLAHYLRARGVKSGDRVAVMLRRGPELVVAVLGILKAGAAYLPLDPDYPASRLSYMLGHARADLLISESALEVSLNAILTDSLPLSTVLLVDAEHNRADQGRVRLVGRDVLADSPETDPPCEHSPEDLMVVLYTSGSTGTPKGVALAHRGYANRLRWHQELFQLQPGERVAQKTSVCFDISVWELLWPLMQGATLCPVDSEVVRNPWRLADWMTHARINVMHFVPSLFGEFLAALGDTHQFPDLRWLVFSGEALPVPFVQRWMDRFDTRVGLANLYGPTEASIDVTTHIVRERPADGTPRIPIGRAMNNVHLLVLDEHMRKLPPGNVGELWIGGVQLAKGYLDDPQRTREAFVGNSFFAVPGAHLYRTGDLVVQLPGGEFDYRGRKDAQVKIRGFRVELGEVEAALSALPGVREAAVRVEEGEDGQKRIHAWLAGTARAQRAVRDELGKCLPDYMIPHAFRWLDRLPKNPNGKLDRKALVANENDLSTVTDNFPAEPKSLSLGPAQSWLLAYFPAPYRWAGFTRFRYRQPLDQEVFNRALAMLAERHPILNVEFHREGENWIQTIPPNGNQPAAGAVQADLYDGSHLSPEARETAVRTLLEAAAGELDLASGRLWRVLVVKCAGDRYDISLAGHHMISDLLSNGILFRELWCIYGDLLLDQEPQLEAVVGYSAYLERLSDLAPQHASYREFWQRHLQGYKFDVPMDHRQGENVVESAASETFVLGREEFQALQLARRHHKVSFYHLLLAPLYRALGEWAGTTQVVLSHRSHGRDLGCSEFPDKSLPLAQDTDRNCFFASVGNFAVNFPVAVDLQAGADWADLLRAIKHNFAALPLNGVSYDLVGAELPDALYPDHKLTPVRANFLGERGLPLSELFEFDATDMDRRYSPPGQPRVSLLEVFLSQVDGSLKVELEYSRNFHRAETIRGLCARYRELLAEVAASLPHQSTPPALRAVASGDNRGVSCQLATKMPSGADRDVPVLQPSNHPRPLAGKVAIVTGASRGIGRAVALKLASQGARLALVARHQADLEQILLEVRRLEVEAQAIAADVADLDQVQDMVSRVAQCFGGVDILVNNAGVTGLAKLADSDPGHWREIMDVNLFGTYHCCQAVLPHLLHRGGGKIVNMGSDSSVIGYPLFGAYAASKHAVLGLTKSLAEEVKGHNIQVNAVCPAFVDTAMTPAAFRKAAIPTEQVAEVVAFLASAAADGITGEPIRVFGRQDMYWYGSGKMSLVQAVAS